MRPVYGSSGKQVVAVNKVQDKSPRTSPSGGESSRSNAASHARLISPKAHAHVVTKWTTRAGPGIVHSKNQFAISAKRSAISNQCACRRGRTAIL